MLVIRAQDGAMSWILVNKAILHAIKLENRAFELFATGLATEYSDVIMGLSAMDGVSYRTMRCLADKIFAQETARWDDVGVVKLHYCFATDAICS